MKNSPLILGMAGCVVVGCLFGMLGTYEYVNYRVEHYVIPSAREWTGAAFDNGKLCLHWRTREGVDNICEDNRTFGQHAVEVFIRRNLWP